MDENIKVYKTSIFPNDEIEFVEKDQLQLSTPVVIVTLIICFFVLKKLIYIKDDKRHGK